MELFELKAMIKEGFKGKKILIFTGEETTLQSVYVNEIAKRNNQSKVYADDLVSIINKLGNKQYNGNGICYIIRNSKDFQKNEDLWNTLESRISNSNFLIFIYDNIDKRGKFYKDLKDNVVDFEKMTTAQLTNVLTKKYLLTEENAVKLIELCNNDYGRILLELDKLKCLTIDKEVNEVFIEALQDDLIYQEINDTSFKLVESILAFNSRSTFALLNELKRFEDAPLKLIGLLYSNFKNLLMLYSKDKPNINYYVIQQLTKHKDKHNPQELIDKLRFIQKVESGIKLGEVEMEFSLDYLIINLLY